ncbi:MAG: hypothetical protein AAGG69_02145 [Pseudomonadota bacterium]
MIDWMGFEVMHLVVGVLAWVCIGVPLVCFAWLARSGLFARSSRKENGEIITRWGKGGDHG